MERNVHLELRFEYHGYVAKRMSYVHRNYHNGVCKLQHNRITWNWEGSKSQHQWIVKMMHWKSKSEINLFDKGGRKHRFQPYNQRRGGRRRSWKLRTMWSRWLSDLINLDKEVDHHGVGIHPKDPTPKEKHLQRKFSKELKSWLKFQGLQLLDIWCKWTYFNQLSRQREKMDEKIRVYTGYRRIYLLLRSCTCVLVRRYTQTIVYMNKKKSLGWIFEHVF